MVLPRFLSLKNLASVFLQLGPEYSENAMQCYLQAVELDWGDVVVWNQLGTLSCSMGSLGMARWAFEQGLISSPTNCKHLYFVSFIIPFCKFCYVLFFLVSPFALILLNGPVCEHFSVMELIYKNM